MEWGFNVKGVEKRILFYTIFDSKNAVEKMKIE